MGQDAAAPQRRMFMELRTGDVLQLAGGAIKLSYKKGQVARLEVCAPQHLHVKKVCSKPVPSLPQ